MGRTIELKTHHMFRVIAIAKKTGFTQEAKNAFKGADMTKMSPEAIAAKNGEVVINLFMSVIENLDKVEKDVYSLLADVTEVTPQEIQDQPFMETVEMIKEIITSIDFGGLFTSPTE